MNRDNRNNSRQDKYSNWHNDNRQEEDNRNRGGFMGNPGTNYAARAFGGAGFGQGLQEDKYRGYNNSVSMERNFAGNYNAKYGNEYHPYERQSNQNDENYNRNRRINYMPDNDNNRSQLEQRYSDHSNTRMSNQARNYKGKGPKGYQRTDERILEDVNDRLSDDPYVDASNIDVKIEGGNAILTGHVDTREAKRRAADIAESVKGVSNVENRLRVGEGILENISKAFTASLGDVTVGHEGGRRD